MVYDKLAAELSPVDGRYGGFVADYDAAYEGVKAGIMQAFYGPPKGGVFSPSVQFTLMEMGKAVLAK